MATFSAMLIQATNILSFQKKITKYPLHSADLTLNMVMIKSVTHLQDGLFLFGSSGKMDLPDKNNIEKYLDLKQTKSKSM